MGRVAIVILVLLLIAFVGPFEPGIPPRHAWHNIEMQQVLLITQAMVAYARDHDGKIPSGRSSTEVFQKLLDGKNWGYIGNPPSIFYFPLKGKTPALDDQALKPENVCFDVTTSVDLSDPDDLPLVFSTGFKVSYEPGASAKRLIRPDFRWPGFEWFRSDPGPSHDVIVIGDKSGQVFFLRVTDDAAYPNGSVRGFIPTGFKANGKTYRQLTPDGTVHCD